MSRTAGRLQGRHTASLFLAALLTVTLGGVPDPVRADPPPWAPAHGYRNKHKGGETVIIREAVPTTTTYTVPPAIAAGHCDRASGINAGTVIGGIVGGALGSQIGDGRGKVAATIGGTLLGMVVGNSISASMGSPDQRCAAQALEYAQEHQPVAWRDPDQGIDYQLTPRKTYQDAQGQYCREYVSKATVGDQVQQVYGTACRQPDGSWRIVQ